MSRKDNIFTSAAYSLFLFNAKPLTEYYYLHCSKYKLICNKQAEYSSDRQRKELIIKVLILL